jgi:hypothetical protein
LLPARRAFESPLGVRKILHEHVLRIWQAR